MNLLLCFGTRPEAIKMAPVIQELQRQDLAYKVCVTGQHREMLDQALNFFNIFPDFDLNLMKRGQSLNELSSNVLREFDQVLSKEQPDLVLVHGDTTTSTMAALASFHRGIKVGHVEAGLRTYNKKAPFPEEINRQITARVSDFHFAPTINARKNLLSEGVEEQNIVVTGNTIVDALFWSLPKLDTFDSPVITELKKIIKDKDLILVTGHRRENVGQGFEELCIALLELAREEDVIIIFPVHLNPDVQDPVKGRLGNRDNIHLIDPVTYPEMLWLMRASKLVISDSGGVQEEAPCFGTPVLVTRDFTERMEGVASGFSILTGSKSPKIVEAARKIRGSEMNLRNRENPYGDGKAALRIVNYLKSQFF